MKRKSIILHLDSLAILNDMTTEQAGHFIKAIYAFNTQTEYNLPDELKLLFVAFKNQFTRDEEKYNAKCERNKSNITKRYQSLPVVEMVDSGNGSLPTVTYNKNNNKSKNKNDSNNILQNPQQELKDLVARYQSDNQYPYEPEEIDYFLNYWNEIFDGKPRWKQMSYFDLGVRLRNAYQKYKQEQLYKQNSKSNRMNTDA